MSKFLDRMKETAKSDVKTIVLPEDCCRRYCKGHYSWRS